MKLQLHENKFKNLIALKFYDTTSSFLYADIDTIEELINSEINNGLYRTIYCFVNEDEKIPSNLTHYTNLIILRKSDTVSKVSLLEHIEYIDVLPFVPKFKLSTRIFDYVDEIINSVYSLDLIINSCIGIEDSLNIEYSDYLENSSPTLKKIFAKLIVEVNTTAISFIDEYFSESFTESENHFIVDLLKERLGVKPNRNNLVTKLIIDMLSNTQHFVQPFETTTEEIYHGYDLIIKTDSTVLLNEYIKLYGQFDDYLGQRTEWTLKSIGLSVLGDLQIALKFIIYAKMDIRDFVKHNTEEWLFESLKDILTIERFGNYALTNNPYLMKFLEEFDKSDLV